MKTCLIALSLVVSGAVYAQELSIEREKAREITPNVEVIRPKPSIEGIVKDIFVSKKPWQMVNPAAPASYGSGQKNVSKDFGPGTPYHSTGWVVAGVEW